MKRSVNSGGTARNRALRGHVDQIRVGPGFVHITGWVCCADDTAATSPISIAIDGRASGGYELNHRADLELAGIAGGSAAINAVLPIANCALDAGHEITFTDATDAFVSIPCGRSLVGQFVPSGHLDQVNARFVLGWVFDPRARFANAPARLSLNDDDILRIVPTHERHDLHFDFGDRGKAFGFEVAADLLRDEIRRRPSVGTRGALLSLVTSGISVAELRVRLADGEIVTDPVPSIPSAPRRVVASDRLDEIMAAFG